MQRLWVITSDKGREGGYVFGSVCLSVCLSVGWITEKVVSGFDEIYWRGRAWPVDQWVQLWWRSGSPPGSRSLKSEIRIHWIIEKVTNGFWWNFMESWGVAYRDQLITFWWRSASLSGSWKNWRSAEVCALWVLLVIYLSISLIFIYL